MSNIFDKAKMFPDLSLLLSTTLSKGGGGGGGSEDPLLAHEPFALTISDLVGC